MEFSHPLARGAKIWPSINGDGEGRRFLIVVTTLVLDPESDKFKPKTVARTSNAAQEFVANSADVAGYV